MNLLALDVVQETCRYFKTKIEGHIKKNNKSQADTSTTS